MNPHVLSKHLKLAINESVDLPLFYRGATMMRVGHKGVLQLELVTWYLLHWTRLDKLEEWITHLSNCTLSWNAVDRQVAVSLVRWFNRNNGKLAIEYLYVDSVASLVRRISYDKLRDLKPGKLYKSLYEHYLQAWPRCDNEGFILMNSNEIACGILDKYNTLRLSPHFELESNL